MQTVSVHCCCLDISPHSGLWGGRHQSHHEGSVKARVVLGQSVENRMQCLRIKQIGVQSWLLLTRRSPLRRHPGFLTISLLESSFHRPAVGAPWDRPLQSTPQLHPACRPPTWPHQRWDCCTAGEGVGVLLAL